MRAIGNNQSETDAVTSVGGNNLPDFELRWKKAPRESLAKARSKSGTPTIAESNRWLNENWDAVIAHGTESTRRLIGRDSL